MGKHALITGAADRIGKAFALELAGAGYNIFLHYNSSEDKAKATQKLVKELGQDCILKQADFKKEEEVRALVSSCQEDGVVDVLINNASNFVESDMATEGSKLLHDLESANFTAPYILTKQFARHCKEGLIVNMLDTKIRQHTTNHLDYVLTKKSLEDFTYLSATQLAPDIRVNGIAPGLVLAPEGEPEGYLEEMAENIPLQEVGTLKQLSSALKFFLNNSFITGEVIHVDGGEHLQ